MVKSKIPIIFLYLSIIPFLCVAQSEKNETEKSIDLVIKGENISIIETFAKNFSPSSTPEIAQLNALKVTETKSIDGKTFEELKGCILFYIPVKEADEIITGNRYKGVHITVIGKLFKQNNLLMIESIEEGLEEDEFKVIPKTSGSQVPEL